MHFYLLAQMPRLLLTLVLFFIVANLTHNCEYCSHKFLNILLDTFATVKQNPSSSANEIIHFLLKYIKVDK